MQTCLSANQIRTYITMTIAFPGEAMPFKSKVDDFSVKLFLVESTCNTVIYCASVQCNLHRNLLEERTNYSSKTCQCSTLCLNIHDSTFRMHVRLLGKFEFLIEQEMKVALTFCTK